MIAALLLIATAHAGDLQLGPSIGFETVTNDPFVTRSGIRAGFHLAPVPWLEAGVAFVYFPVFGPETDWKPLTEQLLTQNGISPDISLIHFDAQATLRIIPLHAAFKHGWRTGVGGLAGGGVVYTVDDNEALQVDADDEAYLSTARQLHGALTFGLLGEIRNDFFGVRLRYERLSYLETINGTTLEMKNNALLATEVMFWFP